ncbi:MAG TPA: substrate-binding domain-containing protein [Acidimicrobiales bacterium]
MAAAAGLVLLATACGDAKESIVVTGSSTVEPISIAVSEKFVAANDDVQIVVDGPGTGDGFELFCDGDADVNDASSKIKPEQVQACEANGVEFIELQIGYDGIAIVTNRENTTVDCLDFADLYALTGPESQRIGSWDDAAPLAESLGSTTTLPDAPLDIVGPGEESGTFVSYVELVIEPFSETRGQPATTRPDYQSTSDDNVIIQGVLGSESSLGWVGYAFARETDEVRTIAVSREPGGPCVQPTDETIADGTYPIARPLFIYVNKERADENPRLRAWVDFYLSDEGLRSVAEVGYVQLSPEAAEATRQVWSSRTTGPQEIQ